MLKGKKYFIIRGNFGSLKEKERIKKDIERILNGHCKHQAESGDTKCGRSESCDRKCHYVVQRYLNLNKG